MKLRNMTDNIAVLTQISHPRLGYGEIFEKNDAVSYKKLFEERSKNDERFESLLNASSLMKNYNLCEAMQTCNRSFCKEALYLEEQIYKYFETHKSSDYDICNSMIENIEKIIDVIENDLMKSYDFMGYGNIFHEMKDDIIFIIKNFKEGIQPEIDFEIPVWLLPQPSAGGPVLPLPMEIPKPKSFRQNPKRWTKLSDEQLRERNIFSEEQIRMLREGSFSEFLKTRK